MNIKSGLVAISTFRRIHSKLFTAACLCLFLVLGLNSRADDASILSKEIPRLRLDNATVEEAINTTLQLCAQANPEAIDIRGVITKHAVPDMMRITMDLKNVPLGMALDTIAGSGLYGWVLRGKVLTFTYVGLGENIITTQLLYFNKNIRRAFKLSDTYEASQLKSILERLKIPLDRIVEIAYNKERDTLVVSGAWESVIEMKCAFDLCSRGVELNPN